MLMEGSREKAAKHCLTPQKEKALVIQIVTIAGNLNLSKIAFAVFNAIFPLHSASIDQHLHHLFVTSL